MNVAVLVRESQVQVPYVPLIMDRSIADAKFSLHHMQTANQDFECAIKIFPKDKASYSAFCREKQIISSLNHENIVNYISNIRFNYQEYDCFFLAMEYAPHGDFFDLISSQELSSEKLIRTYFKQLIDAIEHIHLKEIAHLDLKIENLLIGQDYQLKVADFDQSQPLNDKKLLFKGSPSCRAPEVISGTCSKLSSADMYSIGVILFIFATGDFPFLEKEEKTGIILTHYDLFCNSNDAFWELRIGKRQDKSKFNACFKEIINGLLTKDPSTRWTIEDVKASRWYKGEVFDKKEAKVMMEKLLSDNGSSDKEM